MQRAWHSPIHDTHYSPQLDFPHYNLTSSFTFGYRLLFNNFSTSCLVTNCRQCLVQFSQVILQQTIHFYNICSPHIICIYGIHVHKIKNFNTL